MWQEDVIKVALSQVGLKEGPRNDTPFGKAYGANVGQDWNHQPWCAMFLSWCFAESGHPLPEMQAPGFSGFASAAIGRTYANANGWIVGFPAPGDLAFFDSNGDQRIDHVGIVIAVNPDQTFSCIEGNAGTPQGVYVRQRYRSGVVFARPVPVDEQKKGPCWVHNLCPV
jgi:hypothetical protein